jgi:hypothetical protein
VDQTLWFHRAPSGWEPSDPNPFTPDGTYDRGWSCFRLLDREGETLFTGRAPNGLFVAAAERRVPDLAWRVCDFIRYERGQGRQVILDGPKEADCVEMIRRAWESTVDERAIRANDPPVVVHSTPREAWPAIERDSMLKSTARLRAEGCVSTPLPAETSEVAQYQDGEPAEYADHIMFGQPGNPVVECIIVSKQRGSFCLDADARYTPGVRLYFDLHAIIRDGLGVRDGLHLVKVRDHLPLARYLLGVVGVEDIHSDRPGEEWTPRLFTEEADRTFQQRWRPSGRHGGNT